MNGGNNLLPYQGVKRLRGKRCDITHFVYIDMGYPYTQVDLRGVEPLSEYCSSGSFITVINCRQV